jgi:hypothetical protein
MTIRKGYFPNLHAWLDARNPLYFLFPREMFFNNPHIEGIIYIPLFKELIEVHSVKSLAASEKEKEELLRHINEPHVNDWTYQAYKNKEEELICAISRKDSHPIAWLQKIAPGSDSQEFSIIYQILKMDSVSTFNNSGKFKYPAKIKINAFIDKKNAFEVILLVRKISVNNPDFDDVLTMDPSMARIIEDGDARKIIKVPR